MCTFKPPLCEKDFLQTEQLYGLSPVWILMCAFKFILCEKAFLQTEQLNGFFSALRRGSLTFMSIFQ